MIGELPEFFEAPMSALETFNTKLTVHRDAVMRCATILAREMDDSSGTLVVMRALVHDETKMFEPERSGYAFKYVYGNSMTSPEKVLYKYVSQLHKSSNRHHPEHWIRLGSTHLMDWLAIAEASCDIMSFQIQNKGEDSRRYWFDKLRSKAPWVLIPEEQRVLVDKYTSVISAGLEDDQDAGA
jgi:hypothetical protein